MAKAKSEEATTEAPKFWDTTVKLGAIEEASYAAIGAVVVAVDRGSGEVTLRSSSEKQPHGRSREVVG